MRMIITIAACMHKADELKSILPCAALEKAMMLLQECRLRSLRGGVNGEQIKSPQDIF